MRRKHTRILRIIARLNIGGPAIQAIQLTRKMEMYGFNTLLVCGTLSPGEGDMAYLADEAGVHPRQVAELGRELSIQSDLKALKELRKIVGLYRPHIIHTHTAKAGTLGRLAAITRWQRLVASRSKHRPRLVHTFHGHVFHGYFGRRKTAFFIAIERLLSAFTDRIIAISPTQKDDLVRSYRIVSPDRISIIPLGFDLDVFQDIEHLRPSFRSRYLREGAKSGFVIGIIGRLTGVKNHRLMLQAMHRLAQRQVRGVTLVIVGDGELRAELARETERLNLSDSVVFVGWQRDMRSVYAGVDAVALASKNEGTPVTLIEAMAAGKPVLATRVGGVPDVLGNIVTDETSQIRIAERGILVPSDDPDAMADGLMYLKENRERMIPMTSEAKLFAIERFSTERLCRDLDECYRVLLQQGG